MHYYYDVLANLDTTLWEFYEWEQTDPIISIKKLPLVRVSENDIITFMKYQVVFDKEWISKYLDKTIVTNGKEKLHCILFSSCKNSVLMEFDELGHVLSRSRLLMEDENNCNEICLNLKKSEVPYKIDVKLALKNELRQAIKEKHFIEIELNTLKESKNQKKCSYLYYEWFSEFQDDLEKMLLRMQEELKKEYTMKIHEIALLIKMSYKERL